MHTAPPPMLRRCFIAWMAPPQAWPAIEAARALWHWPNTPRPLSGPDLHITLHFIGDLAGERAQGLIDALAAVAASEVPVRIEAAELWHAETAVLSGPATPAMRALQTTLGQVLVALGLPCDTRRWRPHLTLARHARGAQPPGVTTPVQWLAAGFSLACAADADAGAQRYRIVRGWPG